MAPAGGAAEIVPASLGDRVGVVGAAAVVSSLGLFARWVKRYSKGAPRSCLASVEQNASARRRHVPPGSSPTRMAQDRRVIAFGDGGSAADAQHLVAELVGRFKRDRRPLSGDLARPSIRRSITCITNDYSFDDLFARQVEAHAHAGDVDGRLHDERPVGERDPRACARRARRAPQRFSSPAGDDGGPAVAERADVGWSYPSTSTARVQEMHLLLMHLVVDQVDAWAAA